MTKSKTQSKTRSRSQSNASHTPATYDSAHEELERVREQLATRLRTRGVSVRNSDSADELGSLLEAVEGFEIRVIARGGDLMVDEAPEGMNADPDNPAFVLPIRKANETAASFITRIRQSTAVLHR